MIEVEQKTWIVLIAIGLLASVGSGGAAAASFDDASFDDVSLEEPAVVEQDPCTIHYHYVNLGGGVILLLPHPHCEPL